MQFVCSIEMINMLASIIILLTIISFPCQCVDIEFSCLTNKPFKTKDSKCADFSEICVKTGDPECQSFLGACQQCPPPNTTVTTLLELLKASKDMLEKKIEVTVQQQLNLEKQFNEIANKQQGSLDKRISELAAISVAIISVMVILWLLLTVILILEVRFKLITKLCENCTNAGKKRGYRKAKYKKYETVNNMPSNNTVAIENLHTTNIDRLDSKLNEILAMINNNLESYPKCTNSTKNIVKFQVQHQDKLVELLVDIDDNIVMVKRQICLKLTNYITIDYKRMQLKYSDGILDDNQYLISNMKSIHDIVQCEIDNSINTSEIVVLKVHGNMKIPGLIQMNREKTIADMRIIIEKLTNTTGFKIFKDMVELNDGQTLAHHDIMDDDSIKVIKKQNGHLIMLSILEETDPIYIAYSNVDLVSSVKQRLKESLSPSFDEINLYCNGKYLNEDKFIFDFEISDGSKIEYFGLMNLNRLEVLGDPKITGISSKIYMTRKKLSNKEIFIKMYQFKKSSSWKDCNFIVNELRKCKFTKSDLRFVQLGEFYFDDDRFGVSMEYWKESIKKKISKSESFPEKQISKWSKQILEGFQLLHKHDAVYHNLKSSDIFLDGNNDIKISGFGLSKYLFGYDSNESGALIYQATSSTRFQAPEIITNNPYTMKTDSWYFGAILLLMVTGKTPYKSNNPIFIAKDIENNVELEFKSGDKVNPDLQDFISCCLKTKPVKRSMAADLLQHRFITSQNV